MPAFGQGKCVRNFVCKGKENLTSEDLLTVYTRESKLVDE